MYGSFEEMEGGVEIGVRTHTDLKDFNPTAEISSSRSSGSFRTAGRTHHLPPLFLLTVRRKHGILLLIIRSKLQTAA